MARVKSILPLDERVEFVCQGEPDAKNHDEHPKDDHTVRFPFEEGTTVGDSHEE